MSTEGSDTSSTGLRQFGLYRTIDSRTEEFLRLSRKRQMRQGCACAAISTAITVAVVVSVILIYEYSIIYEPNSKLNWLSLMNDSVETLPFEAKVNKARIQLDPTYIKFLPLILKTIQKNRFFDKIIEDDSSQNPLNEKGEVPEDTYTKNVFSDTRNWMRMPTSRLYTIEYKTSPIIYFKSPTRNIDHFRKVRRIRDYQRIMNYVDKMINDKVTLGSSAPMLSNSRSFYKEPQLTPYTTPMAKAEIYEKKKETSIKKSKYSTKTESTNSSKFQCRCPKNMSVLLNKLITGLQKLLPDIKLDQGHNSTSCNKHHNRVVKTKDNMKIKSNLFAATQPNKNIITKTTIADITSTESSSLASIYQSNNESTSDYFTQNSYSVSTQSNEYQDLFDIEFKNNVLPKRDNTLSSIIKLLTPNWLATTKPYENYDDMTTMKQSIEGTDGKYVLPEITTKPMPKMVTIIKNSATSTSERHLNLGKKHTKYASTTTLPTDDDDAYEDYMDVTKHSIDKYKMLDIHSIELLKRRIWIPRHNIKYNQIQTYDQTTKNPFDNEIHTDIEKEYNNKTWNILNQIGNLAFHKAAPNISNYDIALHANNPTTTEIYANKLLGSTNKVFTMSKPETMEKHFHQDKLEQPLPDDVSLNYEIDKTPTDVVSSMRTTKKYANKVLENTDNEVTKLKPEAINEYLNEDKLEQSTKSNDVTLDDEIDTTPTDAVNSMPTTKNYAMENTNKDFTKSKPKVIEQDFRKDKSEQQLKSDDVILEEEINKDLLSNPSTSKTYTQRLLENTSKEERSRSEPEGIQKKINRNMSEIPLKSDDVTLDDEIDKALTEEFISEDSLKSLETLLSNLNESDIYNKSNGDDNSDQYEWELIKIDDKEDYGSKSMVPDIRSSYLEIQRNDWKQDEPQEYDNNINHYIFD